MFLVSSNFKYTLEKNKTKILIGSSVVLFIGLGVGTYFLITKEKEDNDVYEIEQKLAKYIITGTKDGKLSLIDVESDTEVDSLALPTKDYLYVMNRDYDVLYAYDGETIKVYEVKNNKFVEKDEVVSIKIDNPIDFRVDGNNVAILSNNGHTIHYLYNKDNEQKTEVIELQDNVIDFHINNGILNYSSNTKLYAFSPKTETSIELGDSTNVITTYQDKLLAHNSFGSGLENSILLSLNHESLKIEDLEETYSAETNLLSIDSDDKVFYTTKYVYSDDPYHILDEWRIQDGRIVKEGDISVKIPVGKDGVVYDYKTTTASDGYLYTHYYDRIQIFDIRSQDIHKNVSVDEYFAAPVLNDERID